MRLWAARPSPFAAVPIQADIPRLLEEKSSPIILLLSHHKAEIIMNDTCQICCRPRRQVTILRMVSIRRLAFLRLAAPIEWAAPHQSYVLGGFSLLTTGQKLLVLLYSLPGHAVHLTC